MIERRDTKILLAAIIMPTIFILLTCKSTPAPTPLIRPSEQSALNRPPMATITLRSVLPEGAEEDMIITSGLPNVGVGTYVLLQGGGIDADGDTIASYAWTLGVPDGSVSILDDVASEAPSFIPDRIGQYIVELVVIDERGARSTVASLIVNAATWVGVGAMDDATASPPQCAACHVDQITAWAETGHATSFERLIDGEGSEFFGAHCIGCHTVGYDEAASAVNNGFDDVAAEVGWTFPETLRKGNWDDLMAHYPDLAKLANVQCENCHGPGSEHSGRPEAIALSLETGVCGVCHDPWRQDTNAQWAKSGHADATSPAFTYLIGPGNERCVRCHSGRGFINTYKDLGQAFGASEKRLLEEKREDSPEYEMLQLDSVQVITCGVCHDPHDATHPAQLRMFDAVTLPDGTEVTGVGASAICMACHNGQVGSEQVKEEKPLYPHYSTAAEMMAGTGGYDYGESVDNSAHTTSALGCVGCHMAARPDMDDRGTPDDASDDVPLPGYNEVGEHTFKMAWDGGTPDDPTDDVENMFACTGCHADLTTFNRNAAGDYDGDGRIEGIQNEVQGLLDVVSDGILASGAKALDHYPYWDNATTDAQKAAIYNWSFVAHEGSLGIHNTKRAVQLLQLTYRHLTGQEVPGAMLR